MPPDMSLGDARRLSRPEQVPPNSSSPSRLTFGEATTHSLRPAALSSSDLSTRSRNALAKLFFLDYAHAFHSGLCELFLLHRTRSNPHIQALSEQEKEGGENRKLGEQFLHLGVGAGGKASYSICSHAEVGVGSGRGVAHTGPPIPSCRNKVRDLKEKRPWLCGVSGGYPTCSI